MTTDLIQQEALRDSRRGECTSIHVLSWYDTLIEELQDIITETSFTSRWALVEGYHQVGTRILQEHDNFERSEIYGENITQRIAQSLGKSKRTLNYAIQFAKAYPDLSLLPEGKSISWHHIINKYLTTGEKRVTIKKVDLLRMIKEIKELLNKEYMEAHQEWVNWGCLESDQYRKARVDFIRYLQDQIEKITGELNEG